MSATFWGFPAPSIPCPQIHATSRFGTNLPLDAHCRLPLRTSPRHIYASSQFYEGAGKGTGSAAADGHLCRHGGGGAAACSLTQTKRDGGSAQISQSRGLLSEQAGCRSDSDAYFSFTFMVWDLDVTNLNYSLVGCTLGSVLRSHQHYSQRKRCEKSRDRARTSDSVKDEGERHRASVISHQRKARINWSRRSGLSDESG